MKQKQIWKYGLVSVLAAGLAACSNYENEDAAVTTGPENPEPPTYGSATDVIGTNGTQQSDASDQADIGIGGPVQRELGNYEAQAVQGQLSDREMEKQIRVALTTGSMGTTGALAEDQLTDIQVQARNGIVTLSGPVSNMEERKIIEKRVMGMKGVRAVQNNLQVGGGVGRQIPLNPLTPRPPATPKPGE